MANGNVVVARAEDDGGRLVKTMLRVLARAGVMAGRDGWVEGRRWRQNGDWLSEAVPADWSIWSTFRQRSTRTAPHWANLAGSKARDPEQAARTRWDVVPSRSCSTQRLSTSLYRYRPHMYRLVSGALRRRGSMAPNPPSVLPSFSRLLCK
jgi:hypothetical protein